MSTDEPRGKLPGKTKFSGRRRSTTRSSGFHAHPETSGREFRYGQADTYALRPKEQLNVEFLIPATDSGEWVGYGLWFLAPSSVGCGFIEENASSKRCFCEPAAPNWSKVGSMWISDVGGSRVVLEFQTASACEIALWEPGCGVIEHSYLDDARKELLDNMHRFSPEAHFYSRRGDVRVTTSGSRLRVSEVASEIPLKSCNRCGRYLPINLENEQKHLSFSNHCKAAHLRPCNHTGFGRLKNIETDESLQLEYGFQLECRFCKKFEVNAAHNPQRTAAQMKEDGARRRAFELLLMELYEESAQLRYRHSTGRELTNDVWERFGGTCFACEIKLGTPRDMHLDHTRPLALLWPLDGTATALCDACNSEKRDRPPVDFYTDSQLRRLSLVTGIPLPELEDPTPNLEAVRILRRRLDWFFSDFVARPELTKIRDGKTAAELLIKALTRVLGYCPAADGFDIRAEFERRRDSLPVNQPKGVRAR